MRKQMMVGVLLVGAACAGNAFAAPAQQRAAQTSAPATQQKAPVQQLTPEQQAALQKQNQVLVNYAIQIAQLVDHGQASQVWDQASVVAKKSVSRDAFVARVQADRAQLGTVTSRKVQAVTRAISKGDKSDALPAGYYVNVNFATQFSKDAKPVRELVSFHLDQDKVWRLSGYTVH